MTPEPQILGHRIDFLLTAVAGLREAMFARINDHVEWDEAHLKELAQWVDGLTRLEIDARLLKGKTR